MMHPSTIRLLLCAVVLTWVIGCEADPNDPDWREGWDDYAEQWDYVPPGEEASAAGPAEAAAPEATLAPVPEGATGATQADDAERDPCWLLVYGSARERASIPFAMAMDCQRRMTNRAQWAAHGEPTPLREVSTDDGADEGGEDSEAEE